MGVVNKLQLHVQSMNSLSVKWQKGLTTSHLQINLDPFALKLTSLNFCSHGQITRVNMMPPMHYDVIIIMH